MIPEIGHFALIISLCLAVILTLVPAWGAWRGNSVAMALAPSLSVGLLVFVGISFACLSTAFLQDDFSVKLVASHSNSLLPPICLSLIVMSRRSEMLKLTRKTPYRP